MVLFFPMFFHLGTCFSKNRHHPWYRMGAYCATVRLYHRVFFMTSIFSRILRFFSVIFVFSPVYPLKTDTRTFRRRLPLPKRRTSMHLPALFGSSRIRTGSGKVPRYFLPCRKNRGKECSAPLINKDQKHTYHGCIDKLRHIAVICTEQQT